MCLIEDVLVATGRILIVDDEKTIRDTVARMLNRIGFEVSCADDGQEAIELYKEAKETHQPFDVVILDLNIPGGMGGQETIKRLKEIDHQVKSIVSSGAVDHPAVNDYGRYGFTGSLPKPYTMMELSNSLNRVMLL